MVSSPLLSLSVLLGNVRSEEHTSELQSRETISYAVFCLKKKNHIPSSSFKKKAKTDVLQPYNNVRNIDCDSYL